METQCEDVGGNIVGFKQPSKDVWCVGGGGAGQGLEGGGGFKGWQG